MNNAITLEQIVACLKAAGQAHHILTLQNNVQIVVSEYGGRIFGPFLSDYTASITWTSAAFASPGDYIAFIRNGGWNLGGERVWIAPEIQYIIQDRSNFWGSHRLPQDIEPGQYQLSISKTGVSLAAELKLKAYNIADGTKAIAIRRSVSTAENPLRNLHDFDDLMAGVTFAGYQQLVVMEEMDNLPVLSESWNLAQLNPGGNLIIPCAPRLDATVYLGDADSEALRVRDGAIRIRITGNHQYKTGYKSTCVTGRMGYHHSLNDSRQYLLVRYFFNNPANIYCEEPPDQPGVHGHSIHVYNDGGDLGGFGEMEASGQTLNAQPTCDQYVMALYVGPANKIQAIGEILLGVAL